MQPRRARPSCEEAAQPGKHPACDQHTLVAVDGRLEQYLGVVPDAWTPRRRALQSPPKRRGRLLDPGLVPRVFARVEEWCSTSAGLSVHVGGAAVLDAVTGAPNVAGAPVRWAARRLRKSRHAAARVGQTIGELSAREREGRFQPLWKFCHHGAQSRHAVQAVQAASCTVNTTLRAVQ